MSEDELIKAFQALLCVDTCMHDDAITPLMDELRDRIAEFVAPSCLQGVCHGFADIYGSEAAKHRAVAH